MIKSEKLRVMFTWVPRGENEDADAIGRVARDGRESYIQWGEVSYAV